MIKTRYLLLAALLALPRAAAAGFGMKWVETEVILDRDGKAQVSYAVRWAGSGQLHGFYFEGFQETPVFDAGRAYALDSSGNKYQLDIKKLSDRKYDIVLAGGQAVTSGEITYFFRYAADLQASGNLTQTMSGDRKLAVFNWSPVQWDDPVGHEALTVRFPVALASPQVDDKTLSGLGFMTEKFVNERYSIDYPAVKNAEGRDIFSVRFFRKDLESRYHFQVQVYLDASHFALNTMAYGSLTKDLPQKMQYKPASEKYYLNRYFPGSMLSSLPLNRRETILVLIALAAVFVLLPFVVMTIKHNAMLTAQAGISAVNWDGTEWEPPKA
nr:hypothetical protein [Elusimicrobiota bacterium]